MMAAPRRQRHHRQSRMLVARRHKRPSAEHIQIPHIMCLAERIQHAGLWIGAYPATAHSVDA